MGAKKEDRVFIGWRLHSSLWEFIDLLKIKSDLFRQLLTIATSGTIHSSTQLEKYYISLKIKDLASKHSGLKIQCAFDGVRYI